MRGNEAGVEPYPHPRAALALSAYQTSTERSAYRAAAEYQPT